MANRTYPNDNFAWYNDDNKLYIVERVTSTDTTETIDTYDSPQSSGDLSGNITASSSATAIFVDFTSASHRLVVGDRVTISGTTSYDGNHAVTVVSDANTFRIAATNSESNEGASSGVTWTSLFIDNGLRYTYHTKYTAVSAQTDDLQSTSGLDSGMHQHLLCYVKSRLFEDMGDLQRAQYFRQMFETGVHKYPSRRSGVRTMAVPRI